MTITRSSGVLLHPTSLPGPYGIGELGDAAYAFVDWLARAGQAYWQVMPLGPTGYGDSPYQSFSAFAGNPYLISLDALRKHDLLLAADFDAAPAFDAAHVDFGLQYIWRNQMLDRAFAHFESGRGAHLKADLDTFVNAERAWLDDYALYTAIKAEQGGLPWNAWPEALRTRDAQALTDARQRLERDIRRVQFTQFLFFRQWNTLRRYAHERGIQIIGDIPIFVAMDSADAWANPEQFLFDESGQPTVVAGVPPDYFSETGQLWGNPLYRWDAMQADGFQWWINRFRGSLNLYDIIRIDHFRGFAAAWQIPYPAENAIQGAWVPSPGHALFHAVKGALGDFPIIAEDLGVVTPDVEQLRDDFAFPGMAVLQFAFAGGDFSVNAFLPHNLRQNQVVYTGTHDNDTTRGWWATATQDEKHNLGTYLGRYVDDATIAWTLTEVAFESRANLAVVPLQDLMNLGTEARMNLPGTLGPHNWTWRYAPGALTPDLADRLQALTTRTERRHP
ncbi:4-alpha-glucanotransferase [Deinococcus maricopensis]|uniref:4-alpha-glucanotransferase n=1 Tax=Deinococcus maricopensis (strain DSM 21211 / LMG 22137 / NRRL B-23946 / LB-34) TaxID=709986 RepID=E8U8D8_DEIML|nr:4-alpha-glucanotransferase [Deinococcus maricopensis]ADV67327.1 4-alpha-glucanotransferase [Deinococcus maricopensis DSM 21211]